MTYYSLTRGPFCMAKEEDGVCHTWEVPEFIVQKGGKLNKREEPAATAQLKINAVDSGNLPEQCPGRWTGVIADLPLLQHGTAECHGRGSRGLLKRMRLHWPSFLWKKLPVEAVHPVGAGMALATAESLGSPNRRGSAVDCGIIPHNLTWQVTLASPAVTGQFWSCHFKLHFQVPAVSLPRGSVR